MVAFAEWGLVLSLNFSKFLDKSVPNISDRWLPHYPSLIHKGPANSREKTNKLNQISLYFVKTKGKLKIQGVNITIKYRVRQIFFI